MSDEGGKKPFVGRLLRFVLLAAVWFILLPWLAWSFGALWFDLPLHGWSEAVAIAFGVLCFALFTGFRGGWIAVTTTSVLATLITIWWNQQKPMQHRNWQTEVAVLPRAERDGDQITIHSIRNFAYRTEKDFDARYEERVFHLSKLQGVDLFLNYWGPELIAHPILSFDFENEGRICFSVETRPEKGEAYSALRGLYHGFELICIASDERDVVRLRTNCRENEEVFLYRLSNHQGEEAFLEYLDLINDLHSNPVWYNAVTRNCTTSLRAHQDKADRSQWDWRMLVNGYLDVLLYERGKITNSIPFEDLKKRSHINANSMAADQDPDFSEKIRQGIPGFERSDE